MSIRCPGSNGTVYDTVRGEHIGKISYEKGGDRNALKIEHAPSYVQVYSIDKDGNFTDCPTLGKFEGNTIVNFIWTNSMHCGGGHAIYSYTVSGSKE